MISAKPIRGSFLLPNWLSNRRGLQVGYKIIFCIALAADFIVDQMLWGVRSPLPGVGTYTALALIGRSRALVRGLLETDPQYAATLLTWLAVWQEAGSDETLVKQIQRFIGGSPTVRIVNRAGRFVTIAPDGTITRATDTAWDWDSKSNPERAGWWSDLWIIVYPDPWAVFTGFGDPAWLAAWGVTTGGGIGHATPRAAVDGIYQITANLKGAHTFIEAIIWSTDPALFVPGSLGVAGNPDGWWGGWSRMVAGVPTFSRTRKTAGGHVRYWTPEKTGG